MLSEVHLNKHKTEIRWKKTLNLNTKQVLDITFSRLKTFKIFLKWECSNYAEHKTVILTFFAQNCLFKKCNPSKHTNEDIATSVSFPDLHRVDLHGTFKALHTFPEFPVAEMEEAFRALCTGTAVPGELPGLVIALVIFKNITKQTI